MKVRDLIVFGLFVLLAYWANRFVTEWIDARVREQPPAPASYAVPTPAVYIVEPVQPVYVAPTVYVEPTVDVMPTVQAFYAQPTAESRGGFEAPTVDTGSEVGSHDPGRDDKRRSSP
jgi:hypothetical protein